MKLIFDDHKGMDDEEVIRTAAATGSILITNDKDFGEKVFRDGKIHNGVILIRLSDERPTTKINILQQLITFHGSVLQNNFVVVTEEGIRIAKRV